MKTRYNLSRIMKLAHNYKKRYEITLSQALKLAWKEAKNSEFYIIIEKSDIRHVDTDYNNSLIQQSLINYYNRGSGVYCGD